MPQNGLFIGDRQIELFRSTSKELVENWMNVEVTYFKMNVNMTKVNIYGQAKKGIKHYYPGIQVKCLIDHTPQQLNYEYTLKYDNESRFKILTSTLQDLNLVPQVGDVILWSPLFWQITNITVEQLIANDSDSVWSRILEACVLSDSKVKNLLTFNNQNWKR